VLVKALAGAQTDAEVASLKQRFGDEKVGNFVKVFDFVVADSLKIVTEKHIALPAKVMLDRAVSHPIHDQVMTDIDAKYGIAADADYHAVLTQAMNDLAKVYDFNAMSQPKSAM